MVLLNLDYNNNFYDKLKESIKDLDSLAFGMGLGNDEYLVEVLTFLIKNYTGNLIIDADGLNALSKMDLNIIKEKKCNIHFLILNDSHPFFTLQYSCSSPLESANTKSARAS